MNILEGKGWRHIDGENILVLSGRRHYLFEHEGFLRSVILSYLSPEYPISRDPSLPKILLPQGVPENSPAMAEALAKAREDLAQMKRTFVFEGKRHKILEPGPVREIVLSGRRNYVFEYENFPRAVILCYNIPDDGINGDLSFPKILLPKGIPENSPAMAGALAKAREDLAQMKK